MDKTIQPGNVIAGKYTVETVLGVGGMGMVVKARQAGLDRPVAIKLLLGTFRERRDIVERFYREAKAAARVRSEHVAQVFDVGTTEEGDPYLAMEFLEGEDLDRRLERERRFSLAAAATYMQQACMGVAEAHAARIVHRDLKPANLFVAQSNKGRTLVKVIDFGISKVEEGPSSLTQTGGSMGTVYYMAPEQIENPKAVDGRSDVWALGVIFHQFLTGEVPYGGDTMPMVIANVLKNNRRPVHQIVPGLPPEADQIIQRCLQHDPAKRFQSAQELGEAIAAMVSDPSSSYAAARMRTAPDARAPSLAGHASAVQPGSVPDLMIPDRASAGGMPGSGGALGVAHTQAVPSSSGSGSNMRGNASIELDGDDDAGPALEIDDPRVRSRVPPGSGFNVAGMQGASMHAGAKSSSPRLPANPASNPGSPSGSLIRTDEPVHRSLVTTSPIRRSGPKPIALIFVGVFALVVVLGLGLVIALPRMASSSLQSSLVAGGINATFDSARFAGTGVELTNIDATIAALNGTVVHARKGRLSFGAGDLTLKEVDVVSLAPLDEVARILEAGEPSLPRTVRMEDTHLHQTLWNNIVLDVTGALVVDTIVSGGSGGSRMLTITSQTATVQTPVGTFGPFPLSLERGADKTVLTLGTKDATGLEMTWSATATELKAHAPRAQYALPVKGLGLFTDDAVELSLDLTATNDIAGDMAGKGGLRVWNAKLGSGRVDLAWDFEVSGKDNDVALKTTKATVGPFSGDLRGEWSSADQKKAYLKFHTDTIPCSEVARLRQSHGTSAQILSSLADYAGFAAATGTAAASGVVTVNLESPPRAWASISKNETCGLQIFPGK